jgi:hypothetical protein
MPVSCCVVVELVDDELDMLEPLAELPPLPLRLPVPLPTLVPVPPLPPDDPERSASIESTSNGVPLAIIWAMADISCGW